MLLQDAHTIIERAFHSAPLELLYLRNHSYGYLNLDMGWRALASRDYKAANQFRQQAVAHYSQLRYSWHHIRLGIAIAMVHWFGPQGYDGVRSLTHALRRRISNFT